VHGYRGAAIVRILIHRGCPPASTSELMRVTSEGRITSGGGSNLRPPERES